METQEDKVGVTEHAPVSFPGWREGLHAEISDPSKRNGMEQDIFAWLKFLKAKGRRTSVESVLEYLHHTPFSRGCRIRFILNRAPGNTASS